MIRYFCFLYCVLSFLQAEATEIYQLEDPGRKLQASDVWKSYQEGQITQLQSIRFNAGFTSSVYWLVLKAEKATSDYRLIIGNAHINRIDFFVESEGKISRKFLTGDWFPFESRPINHRLYVFPLNAATGSIYLIRIDKHNESLQLSSTTLTAEDFQQRSAKENLINGLLWGIVLLILIFGCFLFITVGERLYLFYVLFILASSFWVIADKGYGFQYFWADYPEFASRARPVFNCLVTLMILQFMQEFIGQTKESKYFRPILFIKIAVIIIGIAFLFVPYHYHYLVLGFLILLFLVSISPLVLIMLSLYEKIKLKNRQAWFFLVSTFILLLFGGTELIVHSGSSGPGINFLSTYGIQTGLIIQIIILNFGLAYRFNTYKAEKEKLLIEVNKKQQELTGSILETQEKERKDISDQLHDDIGSMLSLASLQISSVIDNNPGQQKDKLQKALDVLGQVSGTVRNMSHSLRPAAIEKYGFENAILDLIKTINLSEKIEVEYVILGMKDMHKYESQFLIDLYRIVAELLNNVLKHSEAKHCLFQLIEYEDALSIMIEDDGKGIVKNDTLTENGSGLTYIQSKIDYFMGEIEVTSTQSGGTLVNIHLPIKR